MGWSEEHDKIFAAVAEAQRLCKAPSKATKGYGYNYADFSAVKSAYAEAVAESCGLGLLDECVPGGEGSPAGFWMVTTVIHKHSEQWMNTRCPVLFLGDGKGKDPMQSYGSAETYARRYNRLKLFDLVPSDKAIEGDGLGFDPNAPPPMGKKMRNDGPPPGWGHGQNGPPPDDQYNGWQGQGQGPPNMDIKPTNTMTHNPGGYRGRNDKKR